MPRLTIVIPWMGAVGPFEETLVSVLQNRPADCDVLVVHRDAYDDPYDLRDEVRFEHCSSAASLCDLYNEGLRRSRGPIVHMMSSGVVAEDGWTDAALASFENHDVGSVSPLVVSANGRRAVASGVAYRGGGGRVLCDAHRSTEGPYRWGRAIWGPTLIAGFYRREAVLDTAGWSHLVGDGLADVDLAASLHAQGWETRCAATCRLTFAGQWPQASVMSFPAGRAWHRLYRRHKKSFGWSAPLRYPLQALRSLRPGADESWLGLPAHVLGRLAACCEAAVDEAPLAGGLGSESSAWASPPVQCGKAA